MTKHIGEIDNEVFINGTEVEFRKGRHELAPQVESGIDPTNYENEEDTWEPGGKPDMETREKHTIAILSLAQMDQQWSLEIQESAIRRDQFPHHVGHIQEL